MNYKDDDRIVMTLDAGGTNFVFSAIQGNKEIIEPITLPSNANELKFCLENIVEGFNMVKRALSDDPVAISFAFPGPSDYPNGIIGDLGNLPAFRGGVALGPMLEEKFQLPVFINNDGDLFVYGEAIAGFLPFVNQKLRQLGSYKQYNNLFGVTLGTGFGAGIVRNGELFLGDNSAGAEIWLMRHPRIDTFIEEGASIRAVLRVYDAHSGSKNDSSRSPKDIYEIAIGQKPGNKEAALKAWAELSFVTADALANAITLVDGLIVIGGGLANAHDIFLPGLVKEMNTPLESVNGKKTNRLEVFVYNLEDEEAFFTFARGEEKEIMIPGTGRSIRYDPVKRIGVGISRLGTSKAVSLGAYAFALFSLDRHS
jgi:glucokinase